MACGLWVAMAVHEQGLMRPGHSLLQQVRGVRTCPQRVNREPLLNPHSRRACSVAARRCTICGATGDPHDELRRRLGTAPDGVKSSKRRMSSSVNAANRTSDLAASTRICTRRVNRPDVGHFQGQTFTDRSPAVITAENPVAQLAQRLTACAHSRELEISAAISRWTMNL